MGSSQEFMGYSNQGMLMEKTFHCDIRKVGCVLSEKKVCGMEMYFVKWKNVILSYSWLFLNGKKKGQNMATESYRRFAEKEH